ncbi:hypothetical protein LCGC14_2864450 [marine sediment metagenome]|uniref:Uncharacterized protein n=1 Tax=marine sediment metagenome TaxID=412755 RepID=A0A0F8Y4P7_9ZZZZ
MPADKDEGKEPEEATAEKCTEQAKSPCGCGCIMPPLEKK